MKASAAGLDLGGGKGVIAAPGELHPEGETRRQLLLDFGELVDSLGGRYVTAEDVGTGADDMAVIAERTRHVVGLDPASGGSGDPSPVTALGVMAAMRACVAHRNGGDRSLDGLEVNVIGVGHVGSELIRLLVAEGARVGASDLYPALRSRVRDLGAEWLEPARRCTRRPTCSRPARSAASSTSATAETICAAGSSAARRTTCSPPTRRRRLLAAREVLDAPELHRQRRRADQRRGGASREGATNGRWRRRPGSRRLSRAILDAGRGAKAPPARGCARRRRWSASAEARTPACETGRVRPGRRIDARKGPA